MAFQNLSRIISQFSESILITVLCNLMELLFYGSRFWKLYFSCGWFVCLLFVFSCTYCMYLCAISDKTEEASYWKVLLDFSYWYVLVWPEDKLALSSWTSNLDHCWEVFQALQHYMLKPVVFRSSVRDKLHCLFVMTYMSYNKDVTCVQWLWALSDMLRELTEWCSCAVVRTTV